MTSKRLDQTRIYQGAFVVSEDEFCTAKLLFQSRNICGNEVEVGHDVKFISYPGSSSKKIFLIPC